MRQFVLKKRKKKLRQRNELNKRTAPTLQSLGKIPMVECNHWLDVIFQQLVDEAVVIRYTGSVRRVPGTVREYP